MRVYPSILKVIRTYELNQIYKLASLKRIQMKGLLLSVE